LVKCGSPNQKGKKKKITSLTRKGGRDVMVVGREGIGAWGKRDHGNVGDVSAGGQGGGKKGRGRGRRAYEGRKGRARG